MTTPVSVAATAPNDETHYHAFLDRMQARFAELTAGKPLFATDANGEALWREYLTAIPDALRQHHNCHACRNFIRRYGGLVVIEDDGETTSPLWDSSLAPAEVREGVQAMRVLAEIAKVNGMFLSSEPVLGLPQTGEWRHFSARVPSVYPRRLLTAGQRMAELREDYRCLTVALSEFTPAVLAQAKTVLEANALARSERFLGVVEWLEARQKESRLRNQRVRNNRLWLAVSAAPAGFCKPRSSMVGTLLEDLLAGMPFEDVKRRFDAKMHPLQYQRPQAAPALGNIKQAEEAIEKLGLKAALDRRFAALADVQEWAWQPKETAGSGERGGVFGHLKPKGKGAATPIELPAETMTWVKFRDTVLPKAERIEFLVPAHSGAFSALVTATDPTAPPLIQWDREEKRNPVSWYFYNGGASAASFSLPAGSWVPLVGITPKPSQWNGGEFKHQGEAVLLVVEGARDTRNSCLALFPEILRSELHGIRSTLEAYSNSRKLSPVEGTLATGLMIEKTDGRRNWSDVQVRVTTPESARTYRLDRWD